MMLLDYKKLWDEAGFGKDNPYPRSMAYVEKIARKEELHKDIVEALIGEFFLEIKAGKTYPLDKCPCGCGIDKSGTAATHALAGRIIKAGDEMREWRGHIVANAINEKILWHIAQENAEYTTKYLGDPKGKTGKFEKTILSLSLVALVIILLVGI